ncbi:hypothetical protein BamMEX5DRAFT_4342 [Burkholderia ambifaria MEX-5]|uniref:Uncharacterized protein n=1 Tax=Burkholderia ambifaria MEX-5 TaxID=396597 RepID=B1T976_9BURK|nr:hypothetical protein BamMEX5DRAFT_4342 [Burkholderia ambifaria MEX-5]
MRNATARLHCAPLGSVKCEPVSQPTAARTGILPLLPFVRHRGRVPENSGCGDAAPHVPHRWQTSRRQCGKTPMCGMAARTTPYIPGGLNLWVLNNLPNCGRSSQPRPSRSATRSDRLRNRTPARSRSPATGPLVGPNRVPGPKRRPVPSPLRRSRRPRSIRSSSRSANCSAGSRARSRRIRHRRCR